MTEFTWLVPAEHPAFAGHFPGRPIVPGVIILDRAILFAEQLLGTPVAGWQIGNAKFLSPVGPGKVLVFSLQQKTSGAITFTVRSGERNVASGSLTPPAP
jgi:3-hydroxymyristoyl/3-hydroxydecanoyl-(acyl carrier protein) dehydratase